MLLCDPSPIFIGFGLEEFAINFLNSLVEDDFAVHPISIELGNLPENGEFVHDFLPYCLV